MKNIIVRLLQDTETIISRMLSESYYLDDNGYANDRFRICIWKDYGIVTGRPRCEFITDYVFIYDERDEDTIYEQYNRWLEDTVYYIGERFAK